MFQDRGKEPLEDWLRGQIELNYNTLGVGLGWRLLYSPRSVLHGADVAYIALNPGGQFRPSEHPDFAKEEGSAYVNESWHGLPKGTDRLQKQSQALFAYIGVEPRTVWAGNLVPYRSRKWSDLPDRRGAVRLGEAIWTEILRVSQPRLVVCLGRETWLSVTKLLAAANPESIPIGWGDYSAEAANFDGGSVVRLPHLSRFALFGRAESMSGVAKLLGSVLER